MTAMLVRCQGAEMTFTVTAGATALFGFKANGPAVTLDSGLGLEDTSTSTIAGATVKIEAPEGIGGESLNFTNQNGITGSYNAATDTLTLSGSATLAQYQTALESITFTSTVDPTDGGAYSFAPIDWSVTDNLATVGSGQSYVDFQPAIIAGALVNYAPGGPAVTLDPGLQIIDGASGTITGGQVSFFGGFVSGDQLNFINQAGITGSYNAATGVLTLTGTASLATYQTALESVTYSFTGTDISGGGADLVRNISWQVTDGASNVLSNSSNVTLAHPIVNAGGGTVSATFTAGQPAVMLDAAVSISGSTAAITTLSGATVSVSSGFLAGDQLHFTNQNGITGSYNSSTGVLTLTGTASLATYETALDSVTYSFAGADDTKGGVDLIRTIIWQVTDSGDSSAVDTSFVDISHPTVNTNSFVEYNRGGAAVVLDPALTVTDPGSATLTGATVMFAPRGPADSFLAGDTLNFVNQNGISGSYNSGTGVLTLSGTASVAAYQTALESISYSFSPQSGDPTNSNVDTARSVQIHVFDGAASSPSAFVNVDVTQNPPIITADATGGTFTGGGPAVQLDRTLALSEPDDPLDMGTITKATVSIGTGFLSKHDALNFTNQSGITGSYNSTTGVLTLTGTASIAAYQTALDSVTYSITPGNLDPTNGGPDTSRTIIWQVFDGSSASKTASSTLILDHTPPTLTAGANATYALGGSPVVADSSLTVSDPDSGGVLTSAIVELTGATFQSGDVLGFINQHGITGSYNSVTGALSLNGTASIADYQTALDSITFSTTSGSFASRSIFWQVLDGVGESSPAYSTVIMFQAPVINAGLPTTFHGGDDYDPLTSASITAGTSAIADVTVAITGGLIVGHDVLFLAADLATVGNIAGSFNGVTGVLTLTSAGATATTAQWQAALGAIEYRFIPPNGDPTGGGSDTTRAIKWTVTDTDGGVGTATGSFDVVHTPPSVTPATATATYVVGGPAVALDPGLTISDPDSGGMIAGATLKVTDPIGDTLTVNEGGSSFSVVGGTLDLAFQGGTIAAVQQTLDQVTVSATGIAPITLTWTVNDGVDSSTPVTSTLNIDHLPTLTAGATATFDGGGPAVILDGALAVVAGTQATLVGATVTISKGLLAGDLLEFTNQNSITGSYDAATGVLTLSGTASVADYQAALDSVSFGFSPGDADPTGGGGDTHRTISWQVNDGFASTTAVSSNLGVVHTPPSVAAGGTATFVGVVETALDTGLTVADPDSSGMLASATVSIGAGFLAGDQLEFLNQNGITGSFNAATGVLTLSGKASVADYQAALDTVSYDFIGSSGDATAGGSDTTRTIDWQVSDGVASSATATSALQAVHTGPNLVAGATTTFTGGSPIALDPGVTVSDQDSGGALVGASISIGAGFLAGDTLAFTSHGGITGSYDAATGVLTLTGLVSLADYQASLDSVTYGFDFSHGDPTTGGTDTGRAITWSVNDGTASASAASTLDVTPVASDLNTAFTDVLRGEPNSPFATSPTITLPDPSVVPNPMYLDAQALAGLVAMVEAGQITLAQALTTIEHFGDATTSVATLAYQFFTGATPTSGGYDYLINSPANPNDLNDPYYAQFNEENRYIDFAVNLGKVGAGASAFNAAYGALDLASAMAKAYAIIFGFSPAPGKIDAILNAIVAPGETRADYFAHYGGDGPDGIGTKAAGVGWLMTVAVENDLGIYAAANDAFLAALAAGTGQYNVGLLTAYPDMTGAQAAAMAAQGVASILAPIHVADTAAGVAASLGALQALAAGNELAGITLSDSAALTITGAQFAGDGAALATIAGPYSLDVTVVGAAQAASVQAGAHVTAFTVTDTAADISASLDALNGDGKLAGISLSDTGPVSLSPGQLTSDAHALGLIAGSYALQVSGTFAQFDQAVIGHITVAGSGLDITNIAPGALSGDFAERQDGALGTLTVTEAGHQISITLLGQPAAAGFFGSAGAAGFTFASDGHGGTEITWG